MYNGIKILTLLVLSLLFFEVNAQQDAQFSHFPFSKQSTNSGYSGVEGVTRATLIHRSQWVGYSGADGGGAPSTQLLSVMYPLKLGGSPLINSGLGLDVVNDKLGPEQNLNVKLNYSYHLRFSNGGLLGLGLNAGFYSHKVDKNILRSIDDDDATIEALGDNQMKPDFGVGLWYQTKKYYAGVSMNHINSPRYEYSNNDATGIASLSSHMYITGGYNLQLGPIIVLTPNAIVRTDFSETSFSYGALGSYNKFKYWGGLYLKQSVVNKADGASGRKLNNDVFTFMIGIGLLDQNVLRIGYAIDIVTSGVQAKSNTSHEFMLSYVLPFGAEVKPPPLRTPRYRHEN